MGNTGAALRKDPQEQSVGLHLRVWLSALLTLVLALFAWWQASQWYQTRLLVDQRAQLEGRLIPYGNALSGFITRRLALLDALTAFVRAEGSDAALQANFPVYATGLSAGVPGVRAIELAPGGVIRYAYPLTAHTAVLGRDLFNQDESPLDYAAVQQALATREPVITGPLDLEQGDLSMTAQQAIYQGDQAWGVARVVLEVPPLLAEANLNPGAPDLELALRRSGGEVFFGPPDVFSADPVVERIDLVTGGWELAAIPRGGWLAAIRERLLIFEGFGLFIVGLVTSLVYLTVSRQTRLAQAVQQRTADLARLNTALQQENAERQQAEEALRERASLLDLTHDTVFVRDMRDVITYWNRGAEELYGWTSTEAIGRVSHQLTRTTFPTPLEAINEELLGTGRWEGELIHSRREGTRVVVASRWSLQRDEQGTPLAILETNNDVTERKRVEEELRKHREQLEELVAERTRELSTLLETSNTIASTLELQPLLRVVLDQLQAVVQYTGATIFFLEGEDMVVLGHSGPLAAEQVAQLRLPAADVVGYQLVRLRGGPIIVDDRQSDSPQARALRESVLATRYEVFRYARSLLLVPLTVRERLIGMLRIDSDQPHFYTERDAQLALAFANQAGAAIENARLYDQARDLATFEERQRLARELHDAVTQTLFSASAIAEALPAAWRQSPEKALRGVEELQRLTRGALAEMRTLLLELRPAALTEKPLSELLGSLCTAVMSRTRIPIELDVEGEALLAPEVQVALYRITQEALNNIAKHAAASQVGITGRCEPERVELRIEDDGRGFEPSAVAPGSLGLGIMRERAASIGATLCVESRPGAGTAVRVEWQAMPAARVQGGRA
jgi:two-component system nitrate/nitrite sensor histidine kinase NarX